MYYVCLIICFLHQNMSPIRISNVMMITSQLQCIGLKPFRKGKDCYVYQYLVYQGLNYVHYMYTPGCYQRSYHLVQHPHFVILIALARPLHYVTLDLLHNIIGGFISWVYQTFLYTVLTVFAVVAPP